MKKVLIEVMVILGKTVLVTLAVPIGFILGGVLRLPDWAQAFGFLPAAYLFCRLSGEPVPPMRRWLPFLLGLGFLTFVFRSVYHHVPESYRTAAFVIFVLVIPSLLKRIPVPAALARQLSPPASEPPQ